MLLADAAEAVEACRGVCASAHAGARACKSVRTPQVTLPRTTACGPAGEELMVFTSACSIHQIWDGGRMSPWRVLQEIENTEEGLD